ncbi:MAG: ferric reductase-like transmembrane domain-containing protein [Chloroflexi bacterium]|nr:ferric reductase-like transmembrane domain-containing protein [Chloroflexota bacterium]
MILLYLTLALGPVARFLPRAGVLLPYRRELGIWFGVFAIVHTIIILDGWVLWDFSIFMGYQYIPAIDRVVRLESGFGMANILGLLAVLIALPLMATSADWATRALGAGSWKFLHYAAYSIFYMVVLHTAYFLYIHFTTSYHRTVPEPNWFQLPFAVLTAMVVMLQAGAFLKTVARQRRGLSQRRAGAGIRDTEPGI